MSKQIVLAVALVLAACTTTNDVASRAADACSLSAEDRAWIDRALEAWRFSAREVTGIGEVRNFQAVFFDDDCVLTGVNAFDKAERAIWTATPHTGLVTLPNGEEMPVGVTSFTSADENRTYFVMSTPSVWRAGGVTNELLGLETMMVGVLIHEGSHVVQSSTYGGRIGALAERHGLAESFNDDSMQARFGENVEFAASIARETDLFFQAAAAPDDTTARRLAREARDLMRARATRWFVGDDVYWTEAEDVWLTFEGTGQWAAYQWVIHPRGANVSTDIAIPNFARRSRWWSQNEGLGIVLALDRIAGPGWKRQAYGAGERTILQMLDAALEP